MGCGIFGTGTRQDIFESIKTLFHITGGHSLLTPWADTIMAYSLP
jgi:hypothetical protein